MKKNLGTADRVIRLFLAALLAVLYFSNVITGIVGTVLIVIAAVIFLTSVVSFCPIYALFHLNTTDTEDTASA